ncbi:hypothetical protein AB0H82_35385 [Streptomyces sp. NPDC050732]|uniref:hypothetical protein n=1 Tax=Streptomyces sp. NPDC050732 TaxID=3154632 RepID=UPI00343B55FF
MAQNQSDSLGGGSVVPSAGQSPDRSATGGALDPSAGNPLDQIPGANTGAIAGLVKQIDGTPVGGSIAVTKEVKDAGQSLGDILGSSGEGGS